MGGYLGRLSVRRVLLQRLTGGGECHVSLRDIEALCGLFCTGGQVVPCVRACARVLKLAGTHGHTTP